MDRRVPYRLLFAALLPVLLANVQAAAAAPRPREPQSPEHGISVFVINEVATTRRDLDKVRSLGFGWAKWLFRWDDLEHDFKGAFNRWEADRVVQATNAAGLKLIGRLDFQPWWSRPDTIRNGPPTDPRDFADFVYAFVRRYGSDSEIGRVHAIQIWNEPNTTREWGGQPITRESASEYVRLLSAVYQAAKAADPDIVVITAGLALTGVNDPSYSWYATTEERRGELIVAALRYAREHWSSWIGVMAVWTLANPSWSLEDHKVWDDEMYWWAITEPNGANRPAFE